MPSSKLNPPATFNFWRPPRTNSTRGVQKRFSGVSWTVPGEARACAWLPGCGPAAPSLQRQPRRRVLDGAPRPRDAAMGLSGRRRGGRQLAAGTPANVILCIRPPPPPPPPAARSDVPAAARGRTSYLTTTVLRVVDRPREGRHTQRGRGSPARPAAAERRSLARWRSLRGELPGELDSVSPLLPRRRVCAAHPLGVCSSLTGATLHSPHTPSGDGSVRVNWRRVSGDLGAASSRWGVRRQVL